MGARVYIPTLGRFLSIDAVEGGTDNNYADVNDPVNDFDLDGNSWLGDMWNNTKKAVVQGAKWAWKNREGIAMVASIGLMFVPGVGAAVGVARVAALAYKAVSTVRVVHTAARLSSIAAKAKNAVSYVKSIRNIQIHGPHHYWKHPGGINGKVWMRHVQINRYKAPSTHLPFGPMYKYKNGIKGPKGRILWK